MGLHLQCKCVLVVSWRSSWWGYPTTIHPCAHLQRLTASQFLQGTQSPLVFPPLPLGSSEGGGNNERMMTSRLLTDLNRLERALMSRQTSTDVDQDRLRNMVSTLSGAEREALMSLLRRGGQAEVNNLNEGRRFRKRNYNLDHLARMNFRRRSIRGQNSAFNDRHILGGL